MLLRCQSLNQLKHEPVLVYTNMLVQRLNKRKRDGPLEHQGIYGSILTLMNDLSTCCPSLCPAPPTQRRGSLGHPRGLGCGVIAACVGVGVGEPR